MAGTGVAELAGLMDPKKAKLAELKAKKAAGQESKAAAVAGQPNGKPARKEKAEKVFKPCKCGCGGQTGAYFIPGHDARFKGWLLQIERGTKEVSSLPPAVQKEYKWKKKGKGVIPTLNYKGEPHEGYVDEDEE